MQQISMVNFCEAAALLHMISVKSTFHVFL